ncbi:TIGR02680 family protein [Virgibacillus kimchii]
MNKWKMNRAGLLNFWYYDEEIFTFSNGKLLLRGSNGSGKSVTMQSFLPVLLDGKTSPDRLDPFGSKARKMEDYLLGEKDIVDRDERTGYLFIEFKREQTDQYMTIGIGLQAKRHKQMKFWGFVITDNRRIGIDFHLYKTERHAGETHKLPLSRVELENTLSDGGHVVQTKSAYMKLVNKYLFQFETVEAYEDLIKLLIQLRSPKLSKDFKPTVIYEILEAALPPLSDDDLRHLSDTIEQMDQTKQQIEQLDREHTAITSLNQVYQTYNERIAAEQANEFLQARNRLAEVQKVYQEKNAYSETLEREINSLSDDIAALHVKKETVEKQEERLKSHKIWNLEKERTEETEKLQQESKQLARKNDQFRQKSRKEHQLQSTLQQIEEDISELKKEMADQLIDLMNDAESASFTASHELSEQDFRRHQQESFDFRLWKKEAGSHLMNLEEVTEKLRDFETLKEKYQEKNKQQAEENKKLDDVLNQEQEWTRLLEEDKAQKLDEIHTWVRDTVWLDMPEEVLQATSRSLHSLYEPASYDTVKEPYRKAVFDYEQEQREKLSQLTFNQDQLEEELAEKHAELQEWKQKKDPEPDADPLTKEARKTLADKGISYTPLYAAVEFRDHVDEAWRKRIEAALIDSGMLNALIVEEDIAVEHDRVLTPAPHMMAHTLADYLKPDVDQDSKLPADVVDEVLRSILIEEDGSGDAPFLINERGDYQLGLLKGHALPVDNVKYIGRNARKRYREEQISRIEQEVATLQAEKQVLHDKIEEKKAAIHQAEMRLNAFPSDADLQESFRQITNVRLKIKHHQEQIEILSGQIKEIYQEYTKVKRTIDDKTGSYNLEVTLPAFQDAIRVMKRYEKDLSELEKKHIQSVYHQSRKVDTQTQLDDLEAELLELQGDINMSETNVKKFEENLKQIEQQLEKQGLTDIRQQIAEVQRELKEINAKLDEKKEIKPGKETEKTHIDGQIEEQRQLVDFWIKMKEAWKQSFAGELQREFILYDKEKELHEAAYEIIKEFGHLLKQKDRSKLSEQLTKEYYNQESDLREYRLNSFSAPFQLPAWMHEVSGDEEKLHVENWEQKMSRQIIELNYLGKQMSPYLFQQQIELERARQESYLNEQDRALYEEILFNTVGQKLRARIRRAEQWVEKMKKLMETRDTSSGLSFSIRWKPRTADDDTEMDTVDLVHLLRQDSKLLKEEDREKIITHFRSKIEKAKEMIEEENELQTFLQVLKEVLDYRKWFSFVLYFQREGEKRRELTNNQFYKFSGGEKAMSMYIPLFTACYSRYSEAGPEAPYIISLDEAFAGVDENNIREMFEIVEELGFDYIMNSQVLWGDYDTIRKLSIYELVRPKNADFVSVIRYHWDGSKINFETPLEAEEEIDLKVRQ